MHALTKADLQLAIHALERESARRISRIEQGDSNDIRNVIIASARRCDDVADKLDAMLKGANR
jgi:hypothetical protein